MNANGTFLLGTRGSQLALAQAGQVRDQVALLALGLSVRLEVIKTLGDGLSERNLPELVPDGAPQGIFTKELDEALLSGRIRAGVHSLKDVPTQLPPGIQYGAYLKREDPRDAFLSKGGRKFFEMPAGSRIGTSSPRREAQIKAVRSDLAVVPLRGNVDTRLRKLAEGDVDGVVVAAAGLRRLGRAGEITELLDPDTMLPAPAQGILCLTLREDDQECADLLKPLNDRATQVCAEAERSFLRTLQGGCRIPVGALATLDGRMITLSGVIAHPNGEQVMRNSRKGSIDSPKELGDELARKFLENGAREILEAFGRISG